MPAKMMSEMPLPMPRSVMRSPSHMMKAVPAVRRDHRHEGEPHAVVGDDHLVDVHPCGRVACRPSEASHREMPMPWTIESTMVP